MSTADEWIIEVHRELDRGEAARAMGNEGMARVCARRAAGIALGEYFHQSGLKGYGSSVQERIRLFKSMPISNDRAQEIADHLLIHVNEDHQLPINIDLLEETHWLIEHLQRKMEPNCLHRNT